MKLLEGRTAVVTGAARGIGRVIASKLAEAGANIAFTDIVLNEQTASLEKELSELGVKAKGYASNASSFSDCEQLVSDVMTSFGQIDILVNNAGITRDNLLMRMTEENWDMVMDINLKSVFNMTKQVLRPMMKARKGSIINISSIVGVKGNAGQANYSASKAGIIGFTKSMAQELGSRNIRVNAVAPGFIQTAMTDKLSDEVKEAYFKSIPLRRFGSPEEVAGTCLFLASDMSSYVSGQVISVCGALST